MNTYRLDDPSVNMLQTPGVGRKETKPSSGGKSFADTMKDSIAKVENMQQSANQAMTDLAVGRTKTLHETMITVEQASISMNLLLAVRGKVINAYHEVMRMQF